MRMKYQLFDSQNEISRELVCVCRFFLTVGMVLFFCQLFLRCSKYQMTALQPKQERCSKTLMDCWRKLINKWASEMMARTWLTWKGHLKGLPKFSNEGYEGCCWFRWLKKTMFCFTLAVDAAHWLQILYIYPPQNLRALATFVYICDIPMMIHLWLISVCDGWFNHQSIQLDFDIPLIWIISRCLVNYTLYRCESLGSY